MDLLILFAVVLGGGLYVIHPVLTRGAPPDPGAHDARRPGSALLEEKDAVVDAIRDLDFEHATGKLSDEDHAELRRRYRVRALELLGHMESNTEPTTSGPPSMPERQVGSPHAGPLFCTSCGAPVGRGHRFCGACGAAIRLLPTTTASLRAGGS